jgi:putative aldouronate transport system substrate-binding protein
MKNIQKGMPAVLAVLMISSILAACGSNSESSKPEDSLNSKDPKATQSPAEQLKEVTLKIILPGDDRPAKQEVLNALYEKTKDKLNAKFEINFVPFSDYQNKLTMMAASGDNYDAAFTADWFGYANFVNKGAFKDLTELMPKYAPDLYKYYKDNNMLSSASVNGKIMAAPWTELKTSKPIFIYRKDIADKLNVQPGDLSTIEGIDSFLTSIAKAKPDMTVFDMAMRGAAGDIVTLLHPKYELWDMGFSNLYMDLNDPNKKVIPLEQTPMFKEAVKLSKKWYDNGIISKNALADKENKPFETGKVFSGKNTVGALYGKTLFTEKTAVKAAVEVYPNKKFARDSQMNNAIVINKNAANPERMLMFLNLITTDRDVYDMFMYGIKDKTYTLDARGEVGFAPGDDPSKPLWQNWNNWGFYRADFARPSEITSVEDMQKTKQFVQRPNIVVSPIAGFTPSPDAIKTELAKRDQLSNEQGKLLLSGIIKGDIDTAINDYIQKQKDAGIDKIIAEVQRQVDEYSKSNK